MTRSEILSPPCDVIPISDVSGLAFDLPRRRVTGPAVQRQFRMIVPQRVGADGR